MPRAPRSTAEASGPDRHKHAPASTAHPGSQPVFHAPSSAPQVRSEPHPARSGTEDRCARRPPSPALCSRPPRPPLLLLTGSQGSAPPPGDGRLNAGCAAPALFHCKEESQKDRTGLRLLRPRRRLPAAYRDRAFPKWRATPPEENRAAPRVRGSGWRTCVAWSWFRQTAIASMIFTPLLEPIRVAPAVSIL